MDGGGLQYAMREAKVPIPLNAPYFTIATKRIQSTMILVLAFLNDHTTTDDGDDGDSLTRNLESISFDSSWSGTDCIVTFNYSQPIPDDDATIHTTTNNTNTNTNTMKNHNDPPTTTNNKYKHWIQQANALCQNCNVTSLILRSKKKKLLFGRDPPILHDQLQISYYDPPQQQQQQSGSLSQDEPLTNIIHTSICTTDDNTPTIHQSQ